MQFLNLVGYLGGRDGKTGRFWPTIALTQIEPEALAGLLDDFDELDDLDLVADAVFVSEARLLDPQMDSIRLLVEDSR